MIYNWRHIDSAPKDGAHILGKQYSGPVAASHSTSPPYVMHWFESDEDWVLSNGDMGTRLFPTHWCPLPAFLCAE